MKNHYNFFLKLLLALFAYFSEIQNLFYAIFFFMFLDWITGVYASYKFRKKKNWFKSSLLSKTIEKFLLYTLAIAAAFVMKKEILAFTNLDRIVAGYIAITELKSIFENMNKILEVDFFSELWTIIKDKFNNKINK